MCRCVGTHYPFGAGNDTPDTCGATAGGAVKGGLPQAHNRTMTELIFWLSLLLAAYPYCGYPVVLAVISKLMSRPVWKKPMAPGVTLIISAYNEEKIIRKKIENSLSLDYPGGQLEIIVVSDCSTDSTNSIVMEYAERNVRLLAMPCRCGKSAGINDAVQSSRGEIIVFSDANALYPGDSIQNIVRNFNDPRVGLVTGVTRYRSAESDGLVQTMSAYTRMERLLKRYESAVGSCVGADGAIFSIRKSLYRKLNPGDINDFILPLVTVTQGYRVIMDEDAFCIEEASPNHLKEFDRQVRITCRTLRALFSHAELLNPLRHPFFSFALFSHKLAKFIVPFVLIALFAANVLLIPAGTAYLATMLLQLLLFAFTLFTVVKPGVRIRLPLIQPTAHFVIMNAAFLMGWMRFFSGADYTIWEHERATPA